MEENINFFSTFAFLYKHDVRITKVFEKKLNEFCNISDIFIKYKNVFTDKDSSRSLYELIINKRNLKLTPSITVFLRNINEDQNLHLTKTLKSKIVFINNNLELKI